MEAWKDISRRLRDTVVRSFVNGAELPCQLQGHAIAKSILVAWGTKQLVTQATWSRYVFMMMNNCNNKLRLYDETRRDFYGFTIFHCK